MTQLECRPSCTTYYSRWLWSFANMLANMTTRDDYYEGEEDNPYKLITNLWYVLKKGCFRSVKDKKLNKSFYLKNFYLARLQENHCDRNSLCMLLFDIMNLSWCIEILVSKRFDES